MIGPRNTLMAIAGIGPTFGEKYSNPTTLPTGNPTGVAFSPAGDALVVTHANSPFITAYGWSSAGFGAKYANPSTALSSVPPDVVFHPSGSHIFTARRGALDGQLIAYPWSAATGFGTQQLVLSNWSFEIKTLKVSPDGTYIALAGGDTLALRSWTGTGFGGEIASRVEDSSFAALDIFDSGGTDYIASVGTATGLWVYPYSGGVLGARFSQGASNQILTGVAFNTPGNFIAWCGNVGGFNMASFVGPGTGATPYGVVQIPTPRVVAFSPLNNAIAVGYSLSPNAGSTLRLYRFTGSRVGNQFAEPSVPPAGPIAPARSLAFSPSGDALAVVHQNSPFITVYKITYNVP